MSRRRILYVTGTRADYGLMSRTLKAIAADGAFDLSLLVTGMHLSAAYGSTVNEIVADGFRIAAEVPVDLGVSSGAAMARNLGDMLIRFTDVLERERPDLVLLLGDRGEMLAGAIGALHLNIPCVHIHGGERSGTVDEPVRHAISKLAHFHLTSTEEARRRLIRMGEREDRVWTVGAPGLDGLAEDAATPRAALLAALDLDPARPVALLVHHPVVQDAAAMGGETEAILSALLQCRCQVVALKPNSDAGGEAVRAALLRAAAVPDVRLVTHFPRRAFVSWMAAADVMIGNSSAGIIEAGSFGTPVINIGSRQNMRERNPNVTDVALADDALPGIIADVLARGRAAPRNLYGDGATAPRIAGLLAALPLDADVLDKCNAY